MHISWLGHSCFKIQDKVGSDGVTLITDPFSTQAVGLKEPKSEADIVTISHDHPDHNNLKAIKGSPFVIQSPGEYDVKGVSIVGVDSFHDDEKGKKRGKNTIYWMEIEGVSVVHLGDLGYVPESKELEKIPNCDILLIPVGGKYTLGAGKAVELVNQIEPRIVIPMHYKTKGVTIDDIEGVDRFVKELGVNPREEEKLKISKKDLPQDSMELIILKIL